MTDNLSSTKSQSEKLKPSPEAKNKSKPRKFTLKTEDTLISNKEDAGNPENHSMESFYSVENSPSSSLNAENSYTSATLCETTLKNTESHKK
ncbi:hypothetical protein GWI33_010759 [Rhynchophorus ferrugineus]|uniref:Uncharacterized protein n=1 Tax=Rhynchophorus ferrugineus TaxID=354439 RepID=A0A834MIT5_RHYFE|nr:hypothetical protein GWI33_010759 [Rhynchophorus ferrugineus]